jgi:hypothetical protein
VIDYSASKGGFDNVMILTMKLRNDNSFAVKDFQIVCANYAPSGTELPASFGTLYEKLKPVVVMLDSGPIHVNKATSVAFAERTHWLTGEKCS